ncbi:DUF3788 domain-containing protein [Anaerosacchariphilus polymeriproducens]|uniref:DUF3788 domain-containing protein n=1 Tax=Anaerosacchariphilus polymeriproducens TaxID=1812858 RepID=A0A371AZI5_9FIRM|nr:DUF3788 domain-containing protein [Anaerosacchariphilus polymeriproducens]RDU24959.1 DUF3788 domain-containing protein [Anaerosacchariphilus polymeriproducens]
MEWNLMYHKNNPPTLKDIDDYVNSELWGKLNSNLQNTYCVQPKLSYSQCSMQPGWNIKYQKSGKSLCTLYPMEGFFIALVVVGNKNRQETEFMLPLFSKYTQDLYQNTVFSTGGCWLMIHVTGLEVLEDVKSLIQIRMNTK